MLRRTPFSLIFLIISLGNPGFSAAEEPARSASGCLKFLSEAGWNEKIQFSAIETQLRENRIAKIEPLADFQRAQGKVLSGTTEVLIVTFDGGTRAVFKPYDAASGAESALGEVMAYRIAERLSLHNVPPTVIREINGRKGSLQYFVQSKVDLLKIDHPISEIVPAEEWTGANLLHYVIGQWDRHAGNYIVDDSGHLAVIDNGDMAGAVEWKLDDFPWIPRGKPVVTRNDAPTFPFANLSGTLTHPDSKSLSALGGGSLSDLHVNRIIERELRYYPEKQFPYVYWRNRLWTQRRNKFGPLSISEIPKGVLPSLKSLTYRELSELIGSMTNSAKIDEIWNRIASLRKIAVSRKGGT